MSRKQRAPSMPRQPEPPHRPGGQRRLSLAILGAVLTVLAALALLLRPDAAPEISTTTPVGSTIDARTKGSPAAPVVIEDWSDFG